MEMPVSYFESCKTHAGRRLGDVTSDTLFTPNPFLGTIITNPAELELLTGSYDARKSMCDNIFDAIDAGRFPTADDRKITFKSLAFSVPPTTTRTLPTNVILDDCTVIEGTLEFSKGTLTAKSNGIAYANGSEATSYARSIHATAYAGNRANAFAEKGGTAIALDALSHAHAKGRKSIVYGMNPGATIYASKRATAITVCEGVVVHCSEGASSRASKLNEKIPLYSKSNGRDWELFKAYLFELNDLAKAGNKDAAYKIGTIDDDELSTFTDIPEPKRRLLTQAHELSHKKAAFELGEFYRKKKDTECALEWYVVARDVSGDKRAPKMIDKLQSESTRRKVVIYC